MTRDERRIHGVHYTTEPLVLRVLHPLFLDDLETQLLQASTIPELHAFLQHLGSLTFLDPACGTGNFLVVALRALMKLESRARERMHGDFVQMPKFVGLHQFFGIERDATAANVALENLSEAARMAGYADAEQARIVVGNALRMDWNEVLPAERASFVFGNPPFVGMAWMTDEQREDRNRAFAFAHVAGLRLGRLDYAASFFAKSLEYGVNKPLRFAYVATNSLCQGEHPRSLGPLFAKYGMHVDFAYRPFRWAADGAQAANVHVVIVGFSGVSQGPKRIFEVRRNNEKNLETRVDNINWYLTSGPNVFPAKRRKPLRAGYPMAKKGSQPTDGGHLLITAGEFDEVLADPIASKYVRRFVQATEFLWNEVRHCLWLVGASAEEMEASCVLRERLGQVRALREASRTRRVRKCANMPGLFTQIRQPNERYLALPEVSSAKRSWIPAAFLEPNVIAGNKLIIVPGADMWHFGMLQSSMFRAWVQAMAGRLKSDISISPDLTYSTFPFPDVDETSRARVIRAADEILRVRMEFVGKSLGELYAPRKMPQALVEAHGALDREVDGLFGNEFVREEGRLGVLLGRYEDLAQKFSDRPQLGI